MTTADPPDATAEPIAYLDALAELDAILAELDGDTVDVDVLAPRVARAAELIRSCQDRITAARLEVERVVTELEAGESAGGNPSDIPPAVEGS